MGLLYGESLEPEKAVKIAFRAYDTNRDGYIDKKELPELMKLSGVEPNDWMMGMAMAMFDADQDGKLNYEEFCAMTDGKI